MIELNNGPDKPHRKCARIVGDTMGKYHPHGDSSIYGRWLIWPRSGPQDIRWSTDTETSGSEDGDGAAAMRYTEARLSKISMEMLADINKDTVDFVPNFDETEKEPTVLPSRYPNLLVKWYLRYCRRYGYQYTSTQFKRGSECGCQAGLTIG